MRAFLTQLLETLFVFVMVAGMFAFATVGAAVLWRVVYWTWHGMMVILP